MILKSATAYSRKFNMFLSGGSTNATLKTVTVVLSKGPGAASVTASGTVTEVDATGLPGLYQVAFTSGDTAVAGDLAVRCVSSGCTDTWFIDQVQTKIFTDLTLDASGNTSITSTLKKNTICNGFTFTMTSSLNNAPQTGLTVAAQVSLAGVAFVPCTNLVSEIGNGVYTINLAAADVNANIVMLRFSATGANDQDILLFTQP
jgi:hypothetical protein